MTPQSPPRPLLLLFGLFIPVVVLGGAIAAWSGGSGGSPSALAAVAAASTPASSPTVSAPTLTATPLRFPAAFDTAALPVPTATPPPTPVPNLFLDAAAAAVLDPSCGALLYDRNAHARLPPASLTKMITALVVVQHTGLDGLVTAQVSAKQLVAEDDESVMGLEPGMQLSVRDLLYGLLLPSGNDAADTLADYVDDANPAGFVDLMNAEAGRLGLKDSHFTNPSGLDDPGLYSSAYDMAIAGEAILRDPVLAPIVATQVYQPHWDEPSLANDNKLLQTYPGAYGVKIGYTDNAGQTIVAAARRNGRSLIVSVFGAKDRVQAATSLLDWAFAQPPTC